MKINTMDTPITYRGVFSRPERAVITAGLLIAVILGMAGGPVGPGTPQTILFALSSLGWVSATTLLALRHARLGESHTIVAAGMAILSVAEMLLWVGGRPGDPGYGQTSAGSVMFYTLALLLTSLPKVYPLLVRILGVLSSLSWAAFAFQFLIGQTLSFSGTLAIAGYVLISLTMIGWLVVLGRTEPQGG